MTASAAEERGGTGIYCSPKYCYTLVLYVRVYNYVCIGSESKQLQVRMQIRIKKTSVAEPKLFIFGSGSSSSKILILETVL